MVTRVLSAVYREVRGLHQAAYVLAIFAFGSQILALIRDRLLAHQFGAGLELDLYYTAFRIPDLLFVLFASMLSVYVLIPFIADSKEGSSESSAREVMSEVFTFFIVAYVSLAALLALFAPQIVAMFFPGFSEHTEELSLLMRILLLQPFFLGLSSLFAVITQMGHRFVLYAVSPLIYNVGIIGGVLFLYPVSGLKGLVFGVVIGAIGHAFIQLPFILKSKMSPSLMVFTRFKNIPRILETSVPRALTLALHQLVLLGLIGFASTMTEGSVAVLQFGFNLQSVPLAIIGVSYSVAAFPMLASLYAEGKMDAFRAHIMTAFRHIIFWSLPILALIIVIRAQLVRVVLGSGAFSWEDTRLTAAVLSLFIISLLAQAIHLLMVRAFYAVGNTRIPFCVTLVSSGGAIFLAILFQYLFSVSEVFRETLESLFRVSGVVGTEVLALALAYSSALILHSAVLVILGARHISFSARAVFTHFSRATIAAIIAGLSAYATLNGIVHIFDQNTLAGVFMQGFIAGIVGIVGGIAAYTLQKSPELREIYQTVHKRLFSSAVAETPETNLRD